MKLDPRIVAEGWLDVHRADVSSSAYRDGFWAIEVVNRALLDESDPKYCLGIISSLLGMEPSRDMMFLISDCIVQEFLLSCHQVQGLPLQVANIASGSDPFFKALWESIEDEIFLADNLLIRNAFLEALVAVGSQREGFDFS